MVRFRNIILYLSRVCKEILYGKRGEPYTFNGITLRYINGSRPIRTKYIESKNDVNRNELLQYQYLKDNLNSNTVFWDIGAHYGTISMLASCCIKVDSKIFAFEPDEEAFLTAEKNIAINNLAKHISLQPIALFSSESDLIFDMQSGNSNSHFITGANVAITGQKRVLKTKTMNGLLKVYPKPSIVKIDTEGAEIDIIMGGEELLVDKSVVFICEIHPFAWSWYKDVRWENFVSTIESHGRKISLLDPLKNEADLPFYGTIIF